MKRNFRRVLTLGFIALLLLALTACGSSIEESLSYLQEQYPDLNIVDGERM